MRRLGLILIALAAMLASSCNAVSNLIHDDEVVARVGSYKLYLSQLQEFLPDGVSPEDSITLARQYINSWAVEKLYVDMAENHLSKNEKDVSRELEDYRNSLLKYRYEQRFVNERLDTVVLASEVEKYYEDHKDLFVLDVPIMKARFLDIMQDSPNKETIRRLMSSSRYEDLVLADSLAFNSAIRYADYSARWTDAVRLAREFGTDYGTMLSRQNGSFIEIEQERGDVKLAYVLAVQKAGTLAPLEFCEERIKGIIISNRKRKILADLEKGMLDDALDRKNLIIY